MHNLNSEYKPLNTEYRQKSPKDLIDSNSSSDDLLNLFEFATHEGNWQATNSQCLSDLFQKINSKDLSHDQMKKITSITRDVYPSIVNKTLQNNIIEFSFKDKIDSENVWALLEWALLEEARDLKSDEHIKKCLDFILHEANIDINTYATPISLEEISSTKSRNRSKIKKNLIDIKGLYLQENYTHPNFLFTVLKLYIKNKENRNDAIQSVKNFGIKDKTKQLEAAKLCAQENITDTINNYHLFDFLENEQLAKLSEQCFINHKYNNSFERTVLYESNLLKIAKHYALNHITNPDLAWEVIVGLKSTNVELLSNIIDFIAENQNPGLTAESIFAHRESSSLNEKNSAVNLTGHVLTFILICAKHCDKTSSNIFRKIFDKLVLDNLSDFVEAEKILNDFDTRKFTDSPFKNTLNDLKKIKDPFAKFQTIIWLAKTMLVYQNRNLSPAQMSFLKNHKIIDSIATIDKPGPRYDLSVQTALLFNNKDFELTFHQLTKELSKNSKKNECQNLIRMFAADLICEGINPEIMISFINAIEKPGSSFYDKGHAFELIQMLMNLSNDEELTETETSELLDRIQKEAPLNTDVDPFLQNIQSVNFLFMENKVDLFRQKSGLNEIADEALKQLLEINDADDMFSTKFKQTFGSCRNPSAIITYAGKINSLNDVKTSNCLKQYIIVPIVNRTYVPDRYKTDNNLHLRTLDEKNPELLSKWKDNLSIELYDLQVNLKEINSLKSAIKTQLNTIEAKTGKDFRFLNSYLENKDLQREIMTESRKKSSGLRKEIQAQITTINKINNTIKAIEKETNPRTRINLNNNLKNEEKKLNEILSNYPDLEKSTSHLNLSDKVHHLADCEIQIALRETEEIETLLDFQFACINWLHGYDRLSSLNLPDEEDKIPLILDMQLEKLKEIQKLMKSGLEQFEFTFIQGKISEIEENLKSLNEIAIETDDGIEILLCGEDQNSCLSVNGEVKNNKGLLGYFEGKNKLLEIKYKKSGKTEKMQARCILHLLTDSDGNNPAIFMEDIYPKEISPARQKALARLALKKAQALQVPLLVDGTSPLAGDLYPGTLFSLGSNMPWEYVDSRGLGCTKDGKYEIKGARYMRLPPN